MHLYLIAVNLIKCAVDLKLEIGKYLITIKKSEFSETLVSALMRFTAFNQLLSTETMNTRTSNMAFTILQISTAILLVPFFVLLVSEYINLFGDSYTDFSKLLMVFICLAISMTVAFVLNEFVFHRSSLFMGIALGVSLFSHYYIIRPGERWLYTIISSLDSFPININMLSLLFLPILVGYMLNKKLVSDAKNAQNN